MTPKLVGITGCAGAGKDTLAAALASVAGYKRVGFADALKRAALESDPMIDTRNTTGGPGAFARLSQLVELYGWDTCKRTVPDVRRYLQRYGVAMRDELPGCWVEAATRRAVRIMLDGHSVAIPDVRFPDEAAAIHELGGVVVRVERPGAGLTGEAAEHPSEQPLARHHVDAVLENAGDLDDLRKLAAGLDLFASRRCTVTQRGIKG